VHRGFFFVSLLIFQTPPNFAPKEFDMTISPLGVQLIKHFESYFDTAYLCPAEVWTIGWGTTVYPDGKPVRKGETCTREQADAWLEFDLTQFSAKVASLTEGVELTAPQFDALVSFTYNLGYHAFGKSTLRKRLLVNPADASIVGNESLRWQDFGRGGQFIRWNQVSGKPSRGIIRRRKAEAWLYATGMNRFFTEILDSPEKAEFYLSQKK
jgi:lysozyme